MMKTRRFGKQLTLTARKARDPLHFDIKVGRFCKRYSSIGKLHTFYRTYSGKFSFGNSYVRGRPC